jgi:antitoxin VapB
METAKLFTNGRNQAVRIPKRYRFSGERVILKKHGRGLLLIPEDDPWGGMLDAMGRFPEDFMSDGRDQGEFEQRDAL